MTPAAQQRAHSCRESALAKWLEQALCPHRPIDLQLPPAQTFLLLSPLSAPRPLCMAWLLEGVLGKRATLGGQNRVAGPKWPPVPGDRRGP